MFARNARLKVKKQFFIDMYIKIFKSVIIWSQCLHETDSAQVKTTIPGGYYKSRILAV
jgi:hypothetical protein